MRYLIHNKPPPPQQKEVQIRKQYRETCKIQTRQFKALKQQIQQSTPRDEQKALLKRIKDEQKRKLALLGQQYEHSIAEMLQKQSVSRGRVEGAREVMCIMRGRWRKGKDGEWRGTVISMMRGGTERDVLMRKGLAVEHL